MPTASRKIIACYLRSSSALLDDHILNRLAARFAPQDKDNREPVVHVELFFPNEDNPEHGVSAGIHYGGQKFMHPKRFHRKDWTFQSIPATETQVSRAKQFCERQKGASFNHVGFFMPGMCNLGHAYRERHLAVKKMPWYCSELVAYTLMHAGIIDSRCAKIARVHPQHVYDILQDNCSVYVDCARSFRDTSLDL